MLGSHEASTGDVLVERLQVGHHAVGAVEPQHPLPPRFGQFGYFTWVIQQIDQRFGESRGVGARAAPHQPTVSAGAYGFRFAFPGTLPVLWVGNVMTSPE